MRPTTHVDPHMLACRHLSTYNKQHEAHDETYYKAAARFMTSTSAAQGTRRAWPMRAPLDRRRPRGSVPPCKCHQQAMRLRSHLDPQSNRLRQLPLPPRSELEEEASASARAGSEGGWQRGRRRATSTSDEGSKCWRRPWRRPWRRRRGWRRRGWSRRNQRRRRRRRRGREVARAGGSEGVDERRGQEVLARAVATAVATAARVDAARVERGWTRRGWRRRRRRWRRRRWRRRRRRWRRRR